MENAVTGDRDIVMPFLCYYDAPKKKKKNHTYAQIYNCAHTVTNTKPGMGSYCLLQYVCGLLTKSTSGIQNSLGTEYKCLTTGRQQNTPAHRHNTGGFGTPMLVLLLSIFQHRRRAGYRTGQDP